MIRKLAAPILFVLLISAGVSAQGDWKKLGQKDVDFHIDHDRIIARNKGHIREIHMSVSKAPVKFQRIVINYKNGEKQDVEFLENVALGNFSRSVTIEGTGRVIDSIDIWYETNSLGGKKAKVTVYGRS